MSDLTKEEVFDAFDDSLAANLQTYTKGRGQYYLQVYVANKEYKDFVENTRQLAMSMDENNKSLKENNNKLTNANDKITENTEALKDSSKDTKDNTKSQKENTEALKAYGRRLVEMISKASGFLGGMVKQEMELTNSLSESNTMYQETAKELNTYANKMNMTLEEYSQFMKENAAEFNTLQRQFGDVREATALDWKKISAQSGATQNEMNKALASYTKLVMQNGEINNMTAEQFRDASSEYIIQTKLLAKAMGTSTDAVLKQTEQAQKQWQYDVLMRDPSKRAQIQVAEMMGHSMDRILYEVGGIMSEGAAMEMALSPAARMESEEFRRRSAAGELNTVADMQNLYTDLSKNPEFLQLQEQQNQFVKENSQMIIYAGQEFAKAITAGTGEVQQKIKNFAELDFEKEKERPINQLQSSINDFEGTVKQVNNDARALVMSGTELKGNLDLLTGGISDAKNKVEEWIENHPKVMEALQKFISKLGIAGLALTMLSTPISFIWKLGAGIVSLIPGLGKFDGSISKLTKSIPSIATSLTSMAKGIISNIGAIGTATYAGIKAKNAYDAYKEGEKAEASKEIIKGAVTATSYGIVKKMTGSDKAAGAVAAGVGYGMEKADEYGGKAGEAVGDWLYSAKKKVSGWFGGNNDDIRNWSPEKLAEARAKLAKLQDNATPQIANSQVQNKAEVQAEAKIKAETEAEAKQSKEEQTLDKDGNLIMPNIKEPKTNLVKMESEEETLFNLREMVSLMKEMTNQLSQLSSQIPMNNYGTVN